MQDYSPIAGFSLTLADQRVSMHKCGSLGTYVIHPARVVKKLYSLPVYYTELKLDTPKVNKV